MASGARYHIRKLPPDLGVDEEELHKGDSEEKEEIAQVSLRLLHLPIFKLVTRS